MDLTPSFWRQNLITNCVQNLCLYDLKEYKYEDISFIALNAGFCSCTNRGFGEFQADQCYISQPYRFYILLFFYQTLFCLPIQMIFQQRWSSNTISIMYKEYNEQLHEGGVFRKLLNITWIHGIVGIINS